MRSMAPLQAAGHRAGGHRILRPGHSQVRLSHVAEVLSVRNPWTMCWPTCRWFQSRSFDCLRFLFFMVVVIIFAALARLAFAGLGLDSTAHFSGQIQDLAGKMG